MITKNKKNSRLTDALLETANDMRNTGIMSEVAYEKITMRHLAVKDKPVIEQLTGQEIRMMREQANMSQSVFAHYLNLTVGYLSQLERGIKNPTGAALALLNVIHRKGMDAVL